MGLIVNVKGISSQGPFAFVAGVGDMTVDLLNQGLDPKLPATQAEVVGQTITVVSRSGADGAPGPAGAPGERGGQSSVQPDLDGAFATDVATEMLLKQSLTDFTQLASGLLSLSFSAWARALGGATGTFRLRVGGSDGGVDGTLLATVAVSSTSFQLVSQSASYTNPLAKVNIKLTGQTSVAGLDAQLKSAVATFVLA